MLPESSSQLHDQFKRLLASWILRPEPKLSSGKDKSKSKPQAKPSGRIWVFGRNPGEKRLSDLIAKEASPWQRDGLGKKTVVQLNTPTGPLWLVRPFLSDEAQGGHAGRLSHSAYSLYRDMAGQAMGQALDADIESCSVEFLNCDANQRRGALVGIEIASYKFKSLMSETFPPHMGLSLRNGGKVVAESELRSAAHLAAAVNMARHLVNLPANLVHPLSLAQLTTTLFKGKGSVEVEVWSHERLRKEKMGLMLAVGAGAEFPPCLVHISYRPKGAQKAAPVAFVGKGITFDSGGLNIKPYAGMRLMKKDMGGAATVAALAWWVTQSGLKVPCDFYLALAENSIGSKSFRPGDIVQSRKGLTIEIHNTDAEGRLVLADAMDVAITRKQKPRSLIDVATLTGAIKAGLGSAVAGLFGNDDVLTKKIEKSAQQSGDWLWHMPLYRKYKNSLRSQVADMVNSSDGFGGAVTAALFLEPFVGDVPWAHLDIYAWKDSADGAYSEAGANGQAVQALAQFLELNKK